MYFVGMIDVGSRINAMRLERGETLAQLGEAAGLSASAVHQWESGATKSLRPANLIAVADHYGVSIRWLVTGEGARVVVETQTEFEAQALLLLRRMSLDGQHAAIDHLNWMVSHERSDPAPSEIDPRPGVKKRSFSR